MESFKKWMEQGKPRSVFSMTSEDRSFLLYSKERDKYFWIVNTRDWEDIHRYPRWYSIVLRNREEASALLNGTAQMSISLRDKGILDRIQKADPDMENRDPDTRCYGSIDSALNALFS